MLAMRIQNTRVRFTVTCLLIVVSLSDKLHAEDNNGASDFGVDYAFLFLMTLSPDFAAANYTFKNPDSTEVDTNIYRLPYHFDLFKKPDSRLQLELAVAYQHTTEVVTEDILAGNRVDSQWNTYGIGTGLLYEYQLSESLRFTPSLRIGLAKMNNDATYSGPLADMIRDTYDGILFNWQTNAAILNLGLGLSYNWKLLDRQSSITANVYHVIVNSFNESNAAVSFSESANMLSVQADMIFPTELALSEERLDFVLLLGGNCFFGENKRTLGYTTSYQAGMGMEIPLRWDKKEQGYLRVSGQVLWAENMDGWLLTIGYNPDK